MTRLAPVDKATGRAAHVEVSHRATEVAGGDARVQLSAELPAPPTNTTVQQAHNLDSSTGRSYTVSVLRVEQQSAPAIAIAIARWHLLRAKSMFGYSVRVPLQGRLPWTSKCCTGSMRLCMVPGM